MKKQLLYIIILLSPLLFWGQQEAQYTQYMYNMSIVNPAYTVENSSQISAGLLHRSQWSGITGAPKTTTLFCHIPINSKIETGFSMVNDNIGDIVTENNFYGDFAYKLDLEENGTISFGIKTGVTFFDVNFNNFQLESGDIFTDPDFENNINRTFFNFGTGIYYNTNNFYVGASIPNLLKAKHLTRNNGKYQGTEEPHWYVTSGMVFNLSDQFKLKPACMFKSVKGMPITVDATANVLYNNKLEFGIGYRINDAFSGLINFSVAQNLRIGYAYDHTISNLGSFNSGSHEIMILYDIFQHKQLGFDKSPRFF